MTIKGILFSAAIFFVFFPLKVFCQTSTPSLALAEVYVIQKGDTFSNIVEAVLADSSLGPELLRFNSMMSPNQIYPGQVLWIPPEDTLKELIYMTDGQMAQVRQVLQNQGNPVTIASLQPTTTATETPSPISTVSAQNNYPHLIGLPVPTKTPSLIITGSKTINISYGQSVGEGVTGISNLGYDQHESLTLNIEGQLNDQVKISGHFSQSDLALQDEYDLALTAGPWEAYFGDFGLSLSGSQYLSSGMQDTGIRVTGTYQNWDVEALYGTPVGRTVYDKFYGNNTQGPYTLSASPITPGTEVVMVDKQALTRGIDYQLDYLLGQITFTTRIPSPSDLIEVQYQSRSAFFNTQDYGYHLDLYLLGDKKSKGPTWTIGQGYLRQEEQADYSITTATAMAATDTHMLDLTSTLDLGPVLKVTGETAYSIVDSSDSSVTPSENGGAYNLQVESFQGPFHLMGKFSKTDPSFSSIGNPVLSNNFEEWEWEGDFKTKNGLLGSYSQDFQSTTATGAQDQTTTDNGEFKAQLKGLPTLDYTYYNSDDVSEDPSNPFEQDSWRHGANLTFNLPGKISFQSGGDYQEQDGTNTGQIITRGINAALSSQGWKGFNFSFSGEWDLNDILEASSNTNYPQTEPGTNLFSQTYTLDVEGKPINNFSLTGTALYSSAPPGPPRTNVAVSYQTDPFHWLSSSGNYTLQLEQLLALGNNTNEQVHSLSGSVVLTPISWWKCSFLPSIQIEVLPAYDQEISSMTNMGFQSSLTPSFVSLSGDYSNDNFINWDSSTLGFPLLLTQNTVSWEITGQKKLTAHLSMTAGYKQSDQDQVNYAATTITSQTQTTNQTENDSLSWNASKILTFTLSHNYTQLNQNSPGQPVASNPLLPNGPDSFSVNYTVTYSNVFTQANTFALRVTEQVSKNLSVYEEGGYTATDDLLQGGFVQTYSPEMGFDWKMMGSIMWNGSYQYNGSTGEVSTQIQKAQTTISASLNQETTLALNWSFAQAQDPYVLNQQGNMSFTMGF